jgi:hypothetical protein
LMDVSCISASLSPHALRGLGCSFRTALLCASIATRIVQLP